MIRLIAQFILVGLLIGAVIVIFLVATGKIDQVKDPFGGCAVHPGQCGER
jgi:hypothetical protein